MIFKSKKDYKYLAMCFIKSERNRTKKLVFQKQYAMFHNKTWQHEHVAMDLTTTSRKYFGPKKITHDKEERKN